MRSFVDRRRSRPVAVNTGDELHLHGAGHASATRTLDTYGRLFEDRLDEVSVAMDAARSAELEQRRRDARTPNPLQLLILLLPIVANCLSVPTQQ